MRKYLPRMRPGVREDALNTTLARGVHALTVSRSGLFCFCGQAHGEPPAFQAAQRGFDSLCPLQFVA